MTELRDIKFIGRRLPSAILLRLVSLLVAALITGAAGPAAADPVFKLVPKMATLKRVGSVLQAFLMLEGCGLDAKVGDPAGLKDVPTGPGDLSYTSRLLDADGDKTGTKRRWLLTATVADPAGVLGGTRYLSFSFRGMPYILPYALAEESKPTFTLKPEALVTKMGLMPGNGFPLRIAATGPGPQLVRLAGEALVEHKGLSPVSGGWVLCGKEDDAPNTCADPVSVMSETATVLWLKPKGPGVFVGEFTGPILIASDRRPEGVVVNLTVDGTSTCSQLLGVGAILLGVALSWLIGTFLRSVSLQRQLLIPLRRLQLRVGRLQNGFGRLRKEVKTASGVFQVQLDELVRLSRDSTLKEEGALPDWKPLAYKAPDDATVTYRAHLSDRSGKAALLDMLLSEGLGEISLRLHHTPSATEIAAAKAASTAIAALSTQPAIIPGATATTISEAVTNFINQSQGQAEFAARAGVFNAKERSVTQLEASVVAINIVTWIVVAVATAMLGAVTLVFNNPAFGVGLDYWICVLWGFGLPAAASQIASTSSVTTALHLSSPA